MSGSEIAKRRQFLEREIEKERATLKAVEADSGAMNPAALLMIGLTLELFEAELKWLAKAESALGSVRRSH